MSEDTEEIARNAMARIVTHEAVCSERYGKINTEVSELKADVKSILAAINQAKGGWKTLLLLSALSGAVGALLAKFLPFIPMR